MQKQKAENKKKFDSAIANLLLQNLRWWIQASFESPANIGQSQPRLIYRGFCLDAYKQLYVACR